MIIPQLQTQEQDRCSLLLKFPFYFSVSYDPENAELPENILKSQNSGEIRF